MQWPRPETCVGQHGMPRTLLARPAPSRTSPRTNLVRPPMRSRPRVLARRKARARAQGDSSAGGSVTSSSRRFARSYLTTSGCGTTSAGRCLTADAFRSVLVDDHAADVLAVAQILVGLVDLVKRVLAGDQLVQFELARLVQVEQLRDVVHQVAVAGQRAADLPVVAD